MPFQIGHKDYRTANSILKLSKTMRALHAHRQTTRNCLVCGKEIKTTIGRIKCNPKYFTYCSRKCKGLCVKVRNSISRAIRGKNNGNWKGGISPLRQRIHGLAIYQKWRKDGFERDNYTCLLCQQKGGILNFDHYIKSFSSILKENKIKTVEEAVECKELWNLSNGRTLCIDCHRKTDNYGHKANKELNGRD